MDLRERPKILKRAVEVTLQNYGVSVILVLTLGIVIIPWWIQWCLFYLGSVVFVSSLIAPYVDDWRPKPVVSTKGKAVFISGCDSGFGYALAQRLDDLGLHVFAGCLFPDGEGAGSLKKSCSERLHVLPLDVTSDDSVEKAVKYVGDNIGTNKFWAVVNNAGINRGGEMTWTSLNVLKSVFEVNALGVIRLTKAFIPLLCKYQGRIITVSSGAGRYTFPCIIPYCISKQAAIAFSDGLRLELYKFGVKVITVEPWMYRTAITDDDNVLDYLSKAWEESPEELKELYPENYIERFKTSFLKTFKMNMSDKPQEVVNCLEEAILASDPKYVYNPGLLKARLSHWINVRLPKSIVDFFMWDHVYNS